LWIELMYATVSSMDARGPVGQLQELREAIEGLDLPLHGDVIAEARGLHDRLDAAIAAAEAQYATAKLPEADGFPGLAAFARHRCGMSLHESHRIARRARRLAAWPELAQAWRAGRVTGSQVELACRIVPARHEDRFAAVAADTAEVLAPLTATQSAKVLRRWVSIADDVARREAAEADAEPTIDLPARELTAPRTLDDEMVLRGTIDEDGAAIVERALLAAARPDAEGERRTPMQRRADALVAVCDGYLASLENPAGNRAKERLTVVADVVSLYRAWLCELGVRTADDLEELFASRPGLGELDRGLFLEAFHGGGGVATTLAGHGVSDALVSAAAAGGALELMLTAGPRILWLGRSVRAFTPMQRRALLAVWGGCAACGAEPERCDVHHVHPWEEGGLTDVGNGVPKCRRCHLDHHRKRWRDRLEPDGTYVLTRPDGSERRLRPANRDAELPVPPVPTTSRPVRSPRFEAWAGRRRSGSDTPELVEMARRLVLARLRLGDGHAATEASRSRYLERLAQLDLAA
jgi:hypothetical protein